MTQRNHRPIELNQWLGARFHLIRRREGHPAIRQRVAVGFEHRSPVQLHALLEHVTLIARQSVENGLPVAIGGNCLLLGGPLNIS